MNDHFKQELSPGCPETRCLTGPVPCKPARRSSRTRWSLWRFRREEDGAIVILSVFMFLIILFLGALGVDYMRFEMERAKLQSTLDRAVLAAADIDQNLDPTAVVNDYFTKSGLAGSVTGVTVTQGLGFRSVSATAVKTIQTQLIHMLGVDTLSAPAAGAAEERVDNVEISLVLDISGSMQNNNKMQNMRAASIDFIDAIFENAAEDKVSLSVVPYNGQVNIGPDLIGKYNITHRHNTTFCVDLPASVYTSAALSRTLPMPQHAFADTFNSSNTYSTTNISNGWDIRDNMLPSTQNRWCDPNPNNRIRVHSDNITQLRNYINALQPVGATSIDAGMRWGSALLDPSARSVVSELVSEGVVRAPFAGRPYDYNDPDVLKVIVLMTDGEHWPNEFINDGFKSGTSPVWVNTSNNRLSIRHTSVSGSNQFYWPSNNSWNNRPEGATSSTNMGTAVQLTWPQVWERARVAWVAHHLYVRPLGGTLANRMNMIRTREGTLIGAGPHEVSTMNARLLNLCNMVKQQGVVIYTVAFEAPPIGRDLLRNCASSSNHAFDVNGLEIRSAFSSIATSIRKLRLTQ